MNDCASEYVAETRRKMLRGFPDLGLGHDLQRIEHALRFPSEFIGGIVNSNDWSFTLQFAAIFEATVAVVLSIEINQQTDPPTIRVNRKVPRTMEGKIKEAIQKQRLSIPDSEFISLFSWLRNQYAHNIGFLRYNIPDFVQHLCADANERKRYLDALECNSGDAYPCPTHAELSCKQAALAYPKHVIFNRALALLPKLLDPLLLAIAAKEKDEAQKKGREAQINPLHNPQFWVWNKVT